MEELILYVKYHAKPGCRESFVRQVVEEGAAHQRVHMEQPHMARLKAIKEQFVDSTAVGKVRLED